MGKSTKNQRVTVHFLNKKYSECRSLESHWNVPDDLRRHGHWLNFNEFQFQGVLNTSPYRLTFFWNIVECSRSHAFGPSGRSHREASQSFEARSWKGTSWTRATATPLLGSTKTCAGTWWSCGGVVGKDWESWRLDFDKLLGQATTLFFFLWNHFSWWVVRSMRPTSWPIAI